MMKTPLKTEPTAILVKRYPSSEACICNSFRPTTGINAGIILITNENNACKTRSCRPGIKPDAKGYLTTESLNENETTSS